jgi:hypothetical protein
VALKDKIGRCLAEELKTDKEQEPQRRKMKSLGKFEPVPGDGDRYLTRKCDIIGNNTCKSVQ